MNPYGYWCNGSWCYQYGAYADSWPHTELRDQTVVSYGMREDWASGHSTSMFEITLDDGSWVRVWMGDCHRDASNACLDTSQNSVAFETSAGQFAGNLGETDYRVWACFEVLFDQVNRTVALEVMDGSSYTTTVLPLANTATEIAHIVVNAVPDNGPGYYYSYSVFDFDSIAIEYPGEPSAPTGLAARGDIAPGEVHLTWSAPADAVSQYNVYRREIGGADSALIGQVPSPSFIDMNVENGVSYAYSVSGTGSTEGPRSPEATTRTLGLPAFSVGFTAVNPDGMRDSATLGTVRSATAGYDAPFDAVEPPSPPSGPYVQTFFENPSSAGTEARLDRAMDAQHPAIVWVLDVITEGSDGTTTLSWGDVSAIGDDAEMLLTDGLQTVNMRSQTSFSFSTPSGSTFHQFWIAAHLNADLGLGVNSQPDRVNLGQTLTSSFYVFDQNVMPASNVVAHLLLDGTEVVSTQLGTLIRGPNLGFSFETSPQQVRGWHTATVRVTTTENESSTDDNSVQWSYLVVERGIDLAENTPVHQTMQLGDGRCLSFALQNTGTDYDIVDLSVEGPSSAWSYSVDPSSIGMNAGQMAYPCLYVSSPGGVRGNPMETQFTIHAVSRGDASKSASVTYYEQIVMTQSLSLQSGWNLVTANVRASDMSPANVFGSSAIFQWNGTAYLSAGSSDVVPGVGYWVPSSSDTTRYLTGEPVDTDPFGLQPGWNLVGAPYDGATLSDRDAEVQNSATTWTSSGYQQASYLAQGHAYWIYRSGSAPAAPAPETFSSPVRFETPSGGASEITIGTSPDATDAYDRGHDAPVAPVAPAVSSVRASVVSPQGPLSRAFVTDAPNASWTVKLRTVGDAGVVMISWTPKSFQDLPADEMVWLVIPTAAGPQKIDMRHVSRAVVPVDAGDITQTLHIELAPLASLLALGGDA